MLQHSALVRGRRHRSEGVVDAHATGDLGVAVGAGAGGLAVGQGRGDGRAGVKQRQAVGDVDVVFLDRAAAGDVVAVVDVADTSCTDRGVQADARALQVSDLASVVAQVQGDSVRRQAVTLAASRFLHRGVAVLWCLALVKLRGLSLAVLCGGQSIEPPE